MSEIEAKEKLEMLENAYRVSKKGSAVYEALIEFVTLEDLAEAIQAIEKQVPKKPKYVLIKYGKHTWKKNEDGEVDDFAWEYDYHNGVVCEVCGRSICVFCNPKYDEMTDCEEEYWECQSCGKKLYSNRKYCDCGQKLKWESDEQ